jgi:hypothetical protein
MKLTLPKVGTWSPPGLPKTQSSSSGGQNISFFYTIGKVFKCRCPKWPHMSHLDICSSSYGQKKGRESNWQFDSQPLKVKNQPEFDVCRRSVTWRWKSSQREPKDCFRPHPNRRSEQEVMDAQSPGSSNQDSFRTPPWESREKVPFRCGLSGELQKIL